MSELTGRSGIARGHAAPHPAQIPLLSRELEPHSSHTFI
jgi:hypothetical protein